MKIDQLNKLLKQDGPATPQWWSRPFRIGDRVGVTNRQMLLLLSRDLPEVVEPIESDKFIQLYLDMLEKTDLPVLGQVWGLYALRQWAGQHGPYVPCPKCHGDGEILPAGDDDQPSVICRTCEGQGGSGGDLKPAWLYGELVDRNGLALYLADLPEQHHVTFSKANKDALLIQDEGWDLFVSLLRDTKENRDEANLYCQFGHKQLVGLEEFVKLALPHFLRWSHLSDERAAADLLRHSWSPTNGFVIATGIVQRSTLWADSALVSLLEQALTGKETVSSKPKKARRQKVTDDDDGFIQLELPFMEITG